MKPSRPSFSEAAAAPFSYVEKTNPNTSNLQFLTYGVYTCAGQSCSGAMAHPGEEALLFCWSGAVSVHLPDKSYALDYYDVLYLPRGVIYRIENKVGQSRVIICRAPATNDHPVFHARWAEISKNEKRIRRLKGKDVYLMFDVTEPADKLVAGYTLFQRHQRSWPPHNHTDQEEIYIFTKGQGSMEVYPDEETKSFVRAVGEGDAVTIPILNYHPVFSQDQELEFIWCIAGERYWVGDKSKAFMTGSVDKLTT
ncbi:MAG: hypothetical protein EXS37_09595 [Opitutus sp.]|nr:hypothetical protein [Opitutus sp.]